MLESDIKTVRALVAATEGNFLHLVVGASQEALGLLDADALKLLPWSAAEVFKECLMKTAPRHRANPH